MTQIMDPDVAQDYDTSILPEVVSFARLCGGPARTSSNQEVKDLQETFAPWYAKTKH